MSSKNQQQSSIFETTLKVASVVLGSIGGIVGLAQLLRKPKVSGFVLEVSRGSALIFDQPGVDCMETVMVNLTVSNRRFQQAAIVEWTLAIEGGEGGLPASRIPETFVIARPGYYPLRASVPESEWPIPDLRSATAQPFKTASGWLRFAFPSVGFDVDSYLQATITATDNLGTKHRIEFVYRDTGGQIWDTNNPGDREQVQKMHGPKPPMN
jgi:hypothetical protein